MQDWVIGAGLVGVVDGVLGVLGLGGLLSALLGDPALRAASVVAALFGLLGLFVLLAVHRGESRRRSAQDRRLRLKYQDVLEERFGYAANVRSWWHDVTVRRNGDTFEKITMTLVADSDLLHYVSIWSGAGSDWPERLRRKVHVDVRTPENGFEGGTRPEVTIDWESRGRLVATVHFAEPVARGDAVSLIVTIMWPGKAGQLMRGQPDTFVRTFTGDAVPELVYRVRLPYPARCDVIGLRHDLNDYTLAKEIDDEGRSVFTLDARGVPVGRPVGMCVDLA
ncbi:hypothetical protein GCM10018954_034710 [Kutzneria kofuensis]